jgi:YfiH family protein
VQAPWGVVLQCTPLASSARHLFTTRALDLRDDENEWRAVAGALDVAAERLRLIRQVHGAEVALARAGDHRLWTRPDADAIVSDDPSVAIGVRVADCAPILMADRSGRVVAAAHAGWRGAMKGVAGAAVRVLTTEFAVDPVNLVAAVGPCLGACCGEVGLEVVDAFREAGYAIADIDAWFQPGGPGKAQLDLPRASCDQLEAAGIPRDQIFSANLCTRTHAAHFHSYRAEGTQAGRMLGAIRAR